MAMTMADFVVITEKAVNNSEASLTLQTDVTRVRISSDVDTEFRVATGGAGFRIAGDSRGEVFENVINWRGQTIYVWSAGNGTVHIMEETKVIG